MVNAVSRCEYECESDELEEHALRFGPNLLQHRDARPMPEIIREHSPRDSDTASHTSFIFSNMRGDRTMEVSIIPNHVQTATPLTVHLGRSVWTMSASNA